MDGAALSLCNDNHLPIVVFDLETPGRFWPWRAASRRGTLVHELPDERDAIWA